VVGFTPQPLYPQGRNPWYPVDKRLGGPQSRYGRGGEEKNSQPLPVFEPPIIQPVAQLYTTELFWLMMMMMMMMITKFVILQDNIKKASRNTMGLQTNQNTCRK
jgi:hypothetical protein